MRIALPSLMACLLLLVATSANAEPLTLKQGDHVSVIGNTTADRMQHHGWLETYIHALHPELNLTFRNLAFPGDELKSRPREDNFGSADEWLAKNKTDVVFAFFGYNEALRGPANLATFKKDLEETIDGMRAQKYNGASAPQLVFFSPIAHENLYSRHLPDGSANNVNLKAYTEAMQQVCAAKDVKFVDLFTPTQEMYAAAKKPLTMNGVHLLENGDKAVAQAVVKELFGKGAPADSDLIAKLHDAVLEKNYYWFSRYRVVDGYNVFGGRSKLAWFGQSNADVMLREMEIFDVMTANRDKVVWGAANGQQIAPQDDNLPEELVVKANREGDKPDGSFSYLTAEGGLEKLQMAEGLQANIFASEEMFPELINPVQMAVDPNGRLFASVWPSYPHWNPVQPRHDRIVCLPDDDGDGVADRCTIFADGLNSVTGFEFWGGGMIVAALPELWFLKDTDGDDKADVKIRILQGLSSADSHHSANAMVLGPDGWIYWSRGIFNVAAMETPTQTYHSTTSGVHRFNPRTYEMEFHFPIGPNPHGDVFDKWGFQFANDGTSGTGSYVNIGKGRGNKQWFDKRVRPVAATGILNSSHFPEKFQNNFLICNCIGFLGVLQHEVKYNGADIRAEEIEPILVSSDPNFRPSDVEIGSDGALYVADWANALIGHMQHNMRDPNRDHQHGRIFRVTAKDRPLVKPVKLKDKPLAEVLNAFYAQESATRYRARIELSGRDSDEVADAVAKFVDTKDVNNPEDAQAMLECIWVHEEHRLPNRDLVARVCGAAEPRVRAAAIRSLGHWAGKVDDWAELLLAAAQDSEPLVRAEAIKAAVNFEGPDAAEVIFLAASQPTDPEIDAVLAYARGQINVDAMITDAIASGKTLSPAAVSYALQKASTNLLLKLDRTPEVYQAILSRSGVPADVRVEAIAALAQASGRTPIAETFFWVGKAEQDKLASLNDLTNLLAKTSPEKLTGSEELLAELADTASTSKVRSAAYQAWIQSGRAEDAWANAIESRDALADFLAAAKQVSKAPQASSLYAHIRPLMFQLPAALQPMGQTAATSDAPAVAFEYYEPHPAQNCAKETLDAVKPTMVGRMENFNKYVPKGRHDEFATRMTAAIDIPAAGDYTFFTASDDGSRIYIDGALLVDHDGLHGMTEKGGKLNLTAGLHEMVVTYFENGGGDGLRISWDGPGIKKQPIPTSFLRPAGQTDLRLAAIDTISAWPGHQADKIADFTKLSLGKENAAAGLEALAALPSKPVIDGLAPVVRAEVLNKLIELANQATPVDRQADRYSRQLNLGEALARTMTSDQDKYAKTLRDLRNSIPVKVDPQILAMGKEVYLRESHCATCHQPHGQGMPNLYPPLDGSIWATGSEDRLISMALDGMHGTIEVKGKRYSSPPLPPMTGFRQLLNDEEMAAVLTYVRNNWTNRAKPITPQQVAKIRAVDRGDATFWFANDLLAKFPLEDGSKPIIAESTGDGWTPKFVKEWKLADLTADKVTSEKRSFATGQVYFARLGCAQCHQLNGKGGNFGPDLSKLDPRRQTAAHVLESILDPSKQIDPQYRMQSVLTVDGKAISGMVIKETDKELHLLTDPLSPDKPTVIKQDDIDDVAKTNTTIMPNGLTNWLTEEEIYDLAAFVLSGGDEKSKVYGK
ncbi:c-type cytochrome [Blastopirellula sp. JC732]|uniref:C-type cytochrome n=1 Tax=Blastopirellula sediminis TaxID=2894196 RepID=A0A9X1SHI8_9BACT|nr:PVC-type heme-binding CxxCH protein [Blastopirellula sediminis]MCC9607953.1 c-type cytochrome [Blastopirellula sediminis]MCC9627254.1 c-type cytochrome [Blastopirellula sediminis]